MLYFLNQSMPYIVNYDDDEECLGLNHKFVDQTAADTLNFLKIEFKYCVPLEELNKKNLLLEKQTLLLTRKVNERGVLCFPGIF